MRDKTKVSHRAARGTPDFSSMPLKIFHHRPLLACARISREVEAV